MKANKPEKQNKKKKPFAFIKKSYQKILKIRGTPKEIAAGFALGLFIGMSPAMGFQTVIAVFFAMILRFNKISSAIGVWISNPFTAPFIYPLTYFIGVKILGVSTKIPTEISSSGPYNIMQKAPEIFWALIIGGFILGIPVALIGYWFSFKAVKKYQEDIKLKIAETKQKLHIHGKRRNKQTGK